MFIRLRLVILLTVICNCVCAGEVETFTGRPAGLITWIPVEYPPKLRSYHWNGKGVFLLKVNPRTGDVDEVKVVKSTGHVLFNEFAAKAFFHWKFQPGVASEVRVPVEFYARGGRAIYIKAEVEIRLQS